MKLKQTLLALLFICSITLIQCSDDENNETPTEICSNGIDDDGDGFTDCEDNDCAQSQTVECNCNDGQDNDGDGFVDSEDNDCN